jgi:hypothetical protein
MFELLAILDGTTVIVLREGTKDEAQSEREILE